MIRVQKHKSSGDWERYVKEMMQAPEREREVIRLEYRQRFEELRREAEYIIRGSERAVIDQRMAELSAQESAALQHLDGITLGRVGGSLAREFGLAGDFRMEDLQKFINWDDGKTLEGDRILIPHKLERVKNYYYESQSGERLAVDEKQYKRLTRHHKMKIVRNDGRENPDVSLVVRLEFLQQRDGQWIYRNTEAKGSPQEEFILSPSEVGVYQTALNQIDHKKIRVAGSYGKPVVRDFDPSRLHAEVRRDKDGTEITVDTTVVGLEYLISVPKSYSVQIALAAQHDPKRYKQLLNEVMSSAEQLMEREVMSKLMSQGTSKSDAQKLKGMFQLAVHVENRNLEPHVHVHAKVSTMGITGDGEARRIDLQQLGIGDDARRNHMELDNLWTSDMVHRGAELGINFRANNASRDIDSNLYDQALANVDVAFSDATLNKMQQLSTSREALLAEIQRRRDQVAEEKQTALEALNANRAILTGADYQAQRREIYDNAARQFKWLSSSEGETAVQISIKAEKKNLSAAELQHEQATRFEQLEITQADYASAFNRDEHGQIIKGTVTHSLTAMDHRAAEERIARMLTDKAVSFTEAQIRAMVASQYIGLSYDEIAAKTQEILSNQYGFFVPVTFTDPSLNVDGFQRYTSKFLMDDSQRIDELCKTLGQEKAKGRYSIDSNTVETFIAGTTLDAGQGEVFRSFFKDDTQIHDLLGFPGAGKSFLAKHIADLVKQQGRSIYGAGLMGSTASDLAMFKDEQGKFLMPAETISKWLVMDKLAHREDEPNMAFRKQLEAMRGQYLVVDECSLVGTAMGRELLEFVKKYEMKILLIGDEFQMNSITAGAFMSQVNDAVHPDNKSVLTKINRQKEAAELDLARVISGAQKLDELLAQHDKARALEIYRDYMKSGDQVRKWATKLETEGRIQLLGNREDAKAQAIDDYFASANPIEEKLILAGSNETVDEMNEAIRRELKAQDEGKPESQKTLTGEEITIWNTVRQKQYEFMPGDRIIITKNGAEVKNGQQGTLQAIRFDEKKKSYTLSIAKDGDVGKITRITATIENGQIPLDIRLSYALTTHKSQGKTIKETFNVWQPSSINSASSANINSTRQKELSHHYAGEDEWEFTKNQLVRSGLNDDLKNYQLFSRVTSNPVASLQPIPQIQTIEPVVEPVRPMERATPYIWPRELEEALDIVWPQHQLEAQLRKEIDHGRENQGITPRERWAELTDLQRRLVERNSSDHGLRELREFSLDAGFWQGIEWWQRDEPLLVFDGEGVATNLDHKVRAVDPGQDQSVRAPAFEGKVNRAAELSNKQLPPSNQLQSDERVLERILTAYALGHDLAALNVRLPDGKTLLEKTVTFDLPRSAETLVRLGAHVSEPLWHEVSKNPAMDQMIERGQQHRLYLPLDVDGKAIDDTRPANLARSQTVQLPATADLRTMVVPEQKRERGMER